MVGVQTGSGTIRAQEQCMGFLGQVIREGGGIALRIIPAEIPPGQVVFGIMRGRPVDRVWRKDWTGFRETRLNSRAQKTMVNQWMHVWITRKLVEFIAFRSLVLLFACIEGRELWAFLILSLPRRDGGSLKVSQYSIP